MREDVLLFGPGSEWFWAMAQFILVAITIVGVYFQLRAQASANTLQRMQFFVDQWDSVAMCHDRLTTALRLRRGPCDEMEPSMLSIAGFFETLGLLERRKHISRSEIFLLGRSVEMWWALLRPSIDAESARHGADFYTDFRRLNGIIHQMDADKGEHFVLDEGTIPGILEDVIRLNLGTLVRAKAIADGDIPDVDGASDPPPATAAGAAGDAAAGTRAASIGAPVVAAAEGAD